MSYNIRDVLGHYVAPKSAGGDLCPHACCQGRRQHPENWPVILRPRMLREATDDELADHYGRFHDEDRARAQVVKEMDRRDRVMMARRATGERNKARAQEHREFVDHEILAAEAATNGYMLNRKGRALGINERSLFTGSEDRALRYASEDLKRYWEEGHPRPTTASMSANRQFRQRAYARSDIGREAVVRGRDGTRTRIRIAA